MGKWERTGAMVAAEIANRRAATQESIDRARIRELEETNADMLKALLAAEWGATVVVNGKYVPMCPVCSGLKRKHHLPDCILDKAIKKARGED